MECISVSNIKFSSELSLYEEGFRKIIEKVCKSLKSQQRNNLKIIVETTESKPVLNLLEGIGAFCPTFSLIKIRIDIKNKKFRADPSGAFSRSLAHEFYHAVRFGLKTSKAQGTFLQCIIDEGLADQFVWEVTKTLPVWNKPLIPALRQRLLKLIFKKADNTMTDKDYDDWFIIGSKRKQIPRWAGYTLGLYIVRKYLKHHRGTSACLLIRKRANQIIKSR